MNTEGLPFSVRFEGFQGLAAPFPSAVVDGPGPRLFAGRQRILVLIGPLNMEFMKPIQLLKELIQY
jgi:hypothetical protein